MLKKQKVHPSYIMELVSIIEKYERALASERLEILGKNHAMPEFEK